MSIEEIKQFKTADGSVFNYLDEATKYNELLGKCDEIEQSLVSRPDDIEYQNGAGWLQHPEGTKITFSDSIMKLYNEWFKKDDDNITYIVGRIIDDNDIRCLNHLLFRWECMSEEDREYGQPYYSNNPYMAEGEQIN
jgi:hypothetical protein